MKIYSYQGKCNVSGRNIRKAREQLKITQEQLAARMQVKGVQVNQKAISRIETGERVVADFELMIFAEVLNVTENELLGGENAGKA